MGGVGGWGLSVRGVERVGSGSCGIRMLCLFLGVTEETRD
jgi:hypothetical protein